MPINSTSLPDDVALLKRMIVTAGIEIEKLKAQIARLRRLQFGRSSKKLDATIAQLELLLDDIEEERGESEEQDRAAGAAPIIADQEKAVRHPLPDHLPREEIVHGPSLESCRCPRCGGTMRRLGEDMSEVLEYVPALQGDPACPPEVVVPVLRGDQPAADAGAADRARPPRPGPARPTS